MPGETPLFERLTVLDDPVPHGAGFNMAADEVLLETLEETPLLRLYRWAEPSLSFGYFTPHVAVAESQPGRALVRRWTGGGVVEHGEDVTYSLFVPRTHPLSNGPAGESYRLIHEALEKVLRLAGYAAASLAPEAGREPDAAALGCFGHPVRHDLLADGRKIGGAAQRRTRRGLLHQGSLLLPDGTPETSERLGRMLPTVFGRTVSARQMTEEERGTAAKLAQEKYAADAWTRRV